MISECLMSTEPVSVSKDTLAQMSPSEFVAAWKALMGEPPATLLESRSEMIRILVESTPSVPPAGAGVAADGLSGYE